MSPHRRSLPHRESTTEENKTKKGKEANSQRWIDGWMDRCKEGGKKEKGRKEEK